MALVAILFIKERPLRRTVDVRPEPAELAGDAPDSRDGRDGRCHGPGFGEHGLHQDHRERRRRAAPSAGTGIVDLDREFIEVLSRERAESRFPDAARQRTRTLVAEDRPEAADVVPVMLQTQRLLAEQQLLLADALRAVHEQAAEQRAIAAEQARVAEELTALRRQLAKQRKMQRAAADYIATHGRHRTE